MGPPAQALGPDGSQVPAYTSGKGGQVVVIYLSRGQGRDKAWKDNGGPAWLEAIGYRLGRRHPTKATENGFDVTYSLGRA